MNHANPWPAANRTRAALYQWFADLFAAELAPAVRQALQQTGVIESFFAPLGLADESHALATALAALTGYDAPDLELAADFAQLFLLQGENSAPPYASFYLTEKKQFFGAPAEAMQRLLQAHHLQLGADFREPSDHLSVYLALLSSLIQHDPDGATLNTQAEFIRAQLWPWLPAFVTRAGRVPVQTGVYPALITLLHHFVRRDWQLLTNDGEKSLQ